MGESSCDFFTLKLIVIFIGNWFYLWSAKITVLLISHITVNVFTSTIFFANSHSHSLFFFLSVHDPSFTCHGTTQQTESLSTLKICKLVHYVSSLKNQSQVISTVTRSKLANLWANRHGDINKVNAKHRKGDRKAFGKLIRKSCGINSGVSVVGAW